MKTEIIKLSVLTFLAGMFCKIYDDMNDNDLFEKQEVLKINKSYINEFLKGIHYILITYVSAKYIYLLFFGLILSTGGLIFDKDAWRTPFELSACIAFSLWGIYMVFENFSSLHNLLNKKLIIITITYLLGVGFVDNFFLKDVEYGYKKLVFRIINVLIIIALFFYNNYRAFCPDEILYALWYLVGYFLTSCCFQIYLIINDKKKVIEEIKDISDNIIL